MSARYASREELAAKVEWEGGLEEMVLGYGLNVDDVPESDTELRDAIAKVKSAAAPFEEALEALRDLLPDECF